MQLGCIKTTSGVTKLHVENGNDNEKPFKKEQKVSAAGKETLSCTLSYEATEKTESESVNNNKSVH